MHGASAELSALATGLDELTRRIGSLAEALDQEPTDRVAIDLYETERALRSAARRLAKGRQALGRI